MNTSRYYKQGKPDQQKNGTRVYMYQSKDLSSVQQQIVEDLSQSSYSQSQTQYDEDSLFTFCNSQNKKNPKLATTQSVAISVESSKGNDSQLKRPKNNLQSSVNIYLSSSNNQLKPNNKRGKSQNSKQNNSYQRSISLKSLTDTFSDSHQSNSSNSKTSFSNSVKFNSKLSSNNNLNLSLDSINSVNKRLTRSATLLQNQIAFNNLFSGQQRKEEMNQQNSKIMNGSSVGVMNPISIVIRGKNQNNKTNNSNINSLSTVNDYEMNKTEATKYKKKDKVNENNIFEDHQMNLFNGATTTTQPKQRKNEMNQHSSYDNGSLDYYQSTAKQLSSRENKINNGNRLIFADERDNKSNMNNVSNNQNFKMLDENQKPLYKIVKKDNNIFNINSSQNNLLNPNNNNNNNGKKADSALTSVTQCKDPADRHIKFSKFNEEDQKGGKKMTNFKRPFFLFDEDNDDNGYSQRNSLKSSDETHLNIDDNNIWNKESNRNNTKNNKGEHIQMYNCGQINQSNIWDQNVLDLSEQNEMNKIFQKKLKHSLQGNQYIGVNNAFTIDYEKLRFTNENNNRLKHFEFNCFQDKDLKVDQKFQKKIQDLTIDDDNQTDDETLDYYVEVCFSDLILAIEMNKRQNDDNDELQSSCSISSKSQEMDPLWQFFIPPNYSGNYSSSPKKSKV